MGTDGIHAIGWWTGKYLILPGDAEAAEESIDGFIGAHANEEILGFERLRGVVVSTTERAQKLLQFDLMSSGHQNRNGGFIWENQTYGSGYLFNREKSRLVGL